MLARLMILMTLCAVFSLMSAQNIKSPTDPLMDHLFAPEFVIQNGQVIGLSTDQKESIKDVVKTSQSTFFDLQWDLKEQMDQFTAMLAADTVDEDKALNKLDRVLGIESKIKKAQMTLMIRIKNSLTTQQQKKLKEIRSGS